MTLQELNNTIHAAKTPSDLNSLLAGLKSNMKAIVDAEKIPTVFKYYNEPELGIGKQCTSYDKSSYTKIAGVGLGGTTTAATYDSHIKKWVTTGDPHLIHTVERAGALKIEVDAEKYTDGAVVAMTSDLRVNDHKKSSITAQWGSVGVSCKMMVAEQGCDEVIHNIARVNKGDKIKLYAHGNPPMTDNVWSKVYMFQCHVTETPDTDQINYYANHAGRELFRKLYNFNMKASIYDAYDAGFRPTSFDFS